MLAVKTDCDGRSAVSLRTGRSQYPAPMSESEEAGQPEAVAWACRKCSAVSTTEGAFCPQCGTPFMRGQNTKGRR